MVRLATSATVGNASTGRSRRHPLVREIGFVLLFKLIAITVLFLLFFRHSERPEVGPPEVSQTIYGIDSPLNTPRSE